MRSFFVVSLLCIFAASAGAAEGEGAPSPSYKMDGLATLTTNAVEHGLTITNKDPSLQGQFWFNWGPQFRLGLWGANVAFPSSDSHFLLRLNADIKVSFSQDADMTLKFTDEHYFKPETRNGNILGLHLHMYGYGIGYDMISNFHGSETRAAAASLEKTWDVFSTWKWENTFGYMMPESSAYTGYFWYETYIGTKPGSIYYQIGANYNSGASQFHGAGDLALLILKATVSF